MQAREWLLTVAVIVVPLIIAVVVTLWSLDQVRYRPKRRRPASHVAGETSGIGLQQDAETPERREQREPSTTVDRGSGFSGIDGRGAGIGQ